MVYDDRLVLKLVGIQGHAVDRLHWMVGLARLLTKRMAFPVEEFCVTGEACK
jgi:hypothetical protein